MNLRKTMIIKETVEADGFGKGCGPITRVVAMAVIQNPFAGRFVEDLSPLFDLGGQLGERLMAEAVEMLGLPPVSYGKAAIVGVAGDWEHGGAMIHPKLGKPMRAAVGGGKALIPSNAKVAALGTAVPAVRPVPAAGDPRWPPTSSIAARGGAVCPSPYPTVHYTRDRSCRSLAARGASDRR